MTPLERVMARVKRVGDVNKPGTPCPLLTIAEFFDGNDDPGSIGCNLLASPPPSVMRAMFEKIAARSDVKDVRIAVTQIDEPDWPFSDTVFVMTAVEPEEVYSWFPDELAPDEVLVQPFDNFAFEPYEVPAGAKPILCWWD